MVAFQTFQPLVENVAEQKINLGGTLVVALSATAPVATWDKLADVTEIAYTNLSSRALTIASSAQVGGVYKCIPNDLTLTASGAVATFRYVIVYDDAATDPVDALVGWYDHGSNVTMANNDEFLIDFGTDGLVTLTLT